MPGWFRPPRSPRRPFGPGLVALALAGLSVAPLAANDGGLDPTFHSTGTLHYGAPGSVDVRSLLVGPDGALVVAGAYFSSGGTTFLHWRRVTDAGQDAACNTDPAGFEASTVFGAAFDRSGRLLLTGSLVGSPESLVVARYLYPACTPDPAFGTGGFARIAIDENLVGIGVAVQSSGKVVVGAAMYVVFASAEAIVLRLTDTGQLDSSFGNEGFATVDLIGSTELLNAFAIDASDRPILAGAAIAGSASLFAARFTAEGAADASFDGNGTIVVPVHLVADGDAEALGIAVASDGSLALVGYAADAGGKAPLVVRLDAAGGLDAGFDGDGIATPWSSPLSHDQRFAAATFQGDGRLIAVGSWTDPATDPESIFVMRFVADGAPDGSFGTFATALFDFDLGGEDRDFGRSVALASGKIAVAGKADREGTADDAFVLRLANGYVFADGFEGASFAAWSAHS